MPDDAPEREGEEGPPVETPEQESASKTWPKWGKYDPAPTHVLKAVSLYLNGTDNMAQIARVLGADPRMDAHKVRRDIDRYLATTRGDPDIEHERKTAIAKWRYQEQEAWAEYRRQEANGNVRLGLLKLLAELAEKIAGAEGVVTKREGVLHGQDPDNPLPPGLIALLSPDTLAALRKDLESAPDEEP